MEKLNFSISINAPKEKVWEILWDDAGYRTWTTAFGEGSHVKTDNWKEGSKVLFLGTKDSGMVSMVAANKPNEFMSFKHLGEIKDGVEDTTSDAVKIWTGSSENYTLTEADGKTTLAIEMDITQEFKEMFEKMWPPALDNVKQLAEGTKKVAITIEAMVKAPVEKVWNSWTEPQHIMQWNNASPDWHCPKSENDVRDGGSFSATMAAKDGSFSFDFGGVHDKVKKNEFIESTIGDGRKMKVVFSASGNETKVTETFEAEGMNPLGMQRGGWQAILNNFKKHTESI